jgi:5-methyltetrahydrofolate corrinoid/iron sulfur protein methyltransferase
MFRVVAENINIMSKKIGTAMRERKAKPIQELAVELAGKGADYLDINLGPARKLGDEMMEFVVRTVHEVVDLPLYLDTSNVLAMEAGLKANKESAGKPIINSVSARPERMEALMPLAQKYNAGFVALVLGEEGIPRDANERGVNVATLMAQGMEFGIPEEDIWIDPIVVPVCSQQLQVASVTEFMLMLPDIAPGYSNTCGLSNVSNGSPEKLRAVLNQTYLLMLMKAGQNGAILDGLDEEIIGIAKGKRPDLEELIGGMMDGQDPDLTSLDDEKRNFAKTCSVLMNKRLYSDSWLEL